MNNVEHSLNVIRGELGNLMQAGMMNPSQYASIMAQLPQSPGQPSPYVDPHYGSPQAQGFNQQLYTAQQDPNHPANPQNKHHSDWAKKFATKLGNAATFGAGATFGGDIANSVFHAL